MGQLGGLKTPLWLIIVDNHVKKLDDKLTEMNAGKELSKKILNSLKKRFLIRADIATSTQGQGSTDHFELVRNLSFFFGPCPACLLDQLVLDQSVLVRGSLSKIIPGQSVETSKFPCHLQIKTRFTG